MCLFFFIIKKNDFILFVWKCDINLMFDKCFSSIDSYNVNNVVFLMGYYIENKCLWFFLWEYLFV